MKLFFQLLNPRPITFFLVDGEIQSVKMDLSNSPSSAIAEKQFARRFLMRTTPTLTLDQFILSFRINAVKVRRARSNLASSAQLKTPVVTKTVIW